MSQEKSGNERTNLYNLKWEQVFRADCFFVVFSDPKPREPRPPGGVSGATKSNMAAAEL